VQALYNRKPVFVSADDQMDVPTLVQQTNIDASAPGILGKHAHAYEIDYNFSRHTLSS